VGSVRVLERDIFQVARAEGVRVDACGASSWLWSAVVSQTDTAVVAAAAPLASSGTTAAAMSAAAASDAVMNLLRNISVLPAAIRTAPACNKNGTNAEFPCYARRARKGVVVNGSIATFLFPQAIDMLLTWNGM
jgi:hypothetical protein